METYFSKIGFVDSKWSYLKEIVQFKISRVIHPLQSFTFGVPCGIHCWVSFGNLFFKNVLCGLQMVRFKIPRVMHPLQSFTFGVHCGVPFPLHAGKGKCCMWLVYKVEI